MSLLDFCLSFLFSSFFLIFSTFSWFLAKFLSTFSVRGGNTLPLAPLLASPLSKRDVLVRMHNHKFALPSLQTRHPTDVSHCIKILMHSQIFYQHARMTINMLILQPKFTMKQLMEPNCFLHVNSQVFIKKGSMFSFDKDYRQELTTDAICCQACQFAIHTALAHITIQYFAHQWVQINSLNHGMHASPPPPPELLQLKP